MRVIHILKDGSIIKDIRGRVVKYEDAGTVYQLIHTINTGKVRMKKQMYKPPEKARA